MTAVATPLVPPAGKQLVARKSDGVQVWVGEERRNLEGYGARLDGSTSDSAPLAAALADKGKVIVPPGKVLAMAAQVPGVSDARLEISHSATVAWTGAAGGTMFSLNATDPTQRFRVDGGGTIDPGGLTNGADIVFDWNSGQHGGIDNIAFLAGRPTTTIVQLRAEATNASGYEGTRNTIDGWFTRLKAHTCGTVIKMYGNAANYVTLNHFSDVECDDVRVKGIDWGVSCDNNYFDGTQRYSLSSTSVNAIGLDVVGDATAYGVWFGNLAVDTFGAPGGDARVAIRLGNLCKEIVIMAGQNDPAAVGGFLVDNGCQSYWILQRFAGDAVQPVGGMGLYVKGIPFIRSDIATFSDSAAKDAKVNVQNTATSGKAIVQVRGKTAGASVVNGSFTADPSGVMFVGTVSAHPVNFISGNTVVCQVSDANTFLMGEGKNIATGTTTGTQVGSAAGQKLALWGKTPNVQPTNAIAAAAFVAGTSGIANDSATFGGYTLGQIAAALVRIGALA